ncbi:hypothetical protein F5883DRAFT_648095 [Diaporthe sp. PMI_573]|nr:hypothetical protein F5883DRAFT_648095 [Diaporthaceae sp. PMI_573]
MSGRITKAWTRRSRAKPSTALQEKVLNAAADKGSELPRSHREQAPANGHLARDASPVPTAKRQLDATSESNPLPAKKARLTRTDAQQPGVEKAGQTDKPEPRPPKRPASFLKGFVDPVHLHSRPESLHTFVSDWLESVGSDRKKRCRSDSHLHRSDDDPVSRQLTRSAPEMGNTRDADGFVVPPTPSSTGTRSYCAGTGSVAPSDASSSRRSGRSLVEDPLYRDMNLAANNIYIRPLNEQFPEDIADLVEYVRQDRDSPDPSLDQVRQDDELNALWMGTGEPEVEDYFTGKIFPKPGASDTLKRSDRQPMAKHAVPSSDPSLKVSTPVPDMLYGYNRHAAFPRQQSQLISMGTGMVANNQSLIYPFFVIEFKSDGPSGAGSLWVATNQCLGGSTSCVKIAERLNDQLRGCKSDNIKPIDSAAFSIAMSGTEARLHVSWKHNELAYYMANVESFLLQKPADYIEFRKYVRNIIDWGKHKRLNEIRDSLDSLLEEGRKRTSQAAKSRQPPPAGSASSNGKKPKSSSRRNSRSDNAKGQRRAADGPYREFDETGSQGTRGGQPSRHHQQSSVGIGDYIPEDAGDGPSLPGTLSPGSDQDQSWAPASLDLAAEPQETHSHETRHSYDHPPSSHRHNNRGPAGSSYAPTHPRFAGEGRRSTRSSSSLDASANSILQTKSSHATTSQHDDNYPHGADMEPASSGFVRYDENESQEAAFFDSAAGTQESVVTSFTSSFALIGTGTGGLDVQEESWPAAQEGEPYAGYDDGFEEPRPSGSLGTT